MKRTIAATFALAIAALLAINGSPANAAPLQALSHIAVCPGPSAQNEARCFARVVADSQGDVQALSLPQGYGPLQFQTAYGLPQTPPGPQPAWSWNGQTIAIVDAFDDPSAEADLNVYSTTFALPPCLGSTGCFTKVNQYGGTSLYPRQNGGWALEISLDVQIAHAICPNCRILLVEAATSTLFSLLAAEDFATAHANVVSNSWGTIEFPWQTANAFDGHFNRPGVAITVAAGDSGYGAEYPASSQYVTAVGGTSLTLNPDNTRASETVWARTGSGCSLFSPKPAWQSDARCPRRTVADVAADADPNTGAAVYDSTPYCTMLRCTTGWFQVGGTSLSSPLIAGIYGLAGNAGSTTYGSFPYGHPGSFYDVASGRNGLCLTYLCAGTNGFDGPSGLGTPNGTGGF